MFDLWISRDDRVKVGQSPRAMDPNVETNTRVLCGSSSCKPSSMVYPIGFLRCVAEMRRVGSRSARTTRNIAKPVYCYKKG